MRKSLRLILTAAAAALVLVLSSKAHGQPANAAAAFRLVTFANLSTPNNASVRYCTDCVAGAPCAGGGTGAFAFRVAGVWNCSITLGVTGGDVVGPGTATDNAAARFDTATGKLLQNSVVLIGDTGNVTGLGTLNTHTIPGGTDTFTLNAAIQTLANKTLTTPVINSPTGIVKGDVGLGNVDNTSDATKNAASVTLTNKTLTTPVIADFTNATHAHTSSAAGGTLSAAAIASGALAQARGGTAIDTSASTGTPVISAGTWSVNTNTGTGSHVRAGSPTFTGAPVLAAPTATTVQTSGNVGFGVAPSGASGELVTAQSTANENTFIIVKNTDGAGTSALAALRANADTAQVSLLSHGTGRTTSRWSVTLGGWNELLASVGNGLAIGTPASAGGLKIGTAAIAVINIDTSQNLTITNSNSSGQCTLNGAATATCTHTVASGCIPICTYNSAATPHTISCSVTTTTLTAVSATTLDGGVVNYHCF